MVNKELKAMEGESAEERFYREIESQLSSEEKSRIGSDPGRRVGEAIMYLTPFAPAPATFDAEAFGAVTMLQGEELTYTLDALVRIGVLAVNNGRYTIINQALVDSFSQFMDT
jgi:hypothetical protein